MSRLLHRQMKARPTYKTDKLKSTFCQMISALTLYELNNIVSEVISSVMSEEYWVEAEISELRVVYGHCYMELVQKAEDTKTPVARSSAKCWRTYWTLVRTAFERVTGRELCAGMKVMMRVHADFHEAYGFSWIVTDINPEYTLGDIARRRREIIAQLKEEGVLELQKELVLPLFTQRVAVISSDNAAGYDDFCNQLHGNDKGLAFSVKLFRAVMQGEATESSVIGALDDIYSQVDKFDVVVIIRGGGATSDLSGFDTLSLAENVANFPLPIIVGIGHNRDESVLDIVANQSVKTPTAAATFLVDRLAAVAARVDSAASYVSKYALDRIERENSRMKYLSTVLPSLYAAVKSREMSRITQLRDSLYVAVRQTTADAKAALDAMPMRLAGAVRQNLTAERHRLEMLGQRTAAVDPQRMLSRGYSITLHEGRAVTASSALREGDTLETLLADGRVISKVDRISKNKR